MQARHRGFTLVELLIALAVMALVAILGWRGLDGMTRAQAGTRAHTDAVLTLQAGLAQWTTDLDAMVDVEAYEGTALDWDGRALRIVRSANQTEQAGVQVVAWTLRSPAAGGQWMRWQSPPLRTRAALQQAWERAAQWAQTPTPDVRQYEVAIVPALDWRVVFNRNGAWTNALSSPGTTAPGSKSELPDGVRLELELPPGSAVPGLLTRVWARPTVGGNAS